METRLRVLVAAGLVLIVGAWLALRGAPAPAAGDLDEGSSALEEVASPAEVSEETPTVMPLRTEPFVPPGPAEGEVASTEESERCTLRGITVTVRVRDRWGNAVDLAKALLIGQQNDLITSLFLPLDTSVDRPDALVRKDVVPGQYALQVEAPGFVPRRIPLEIDGAELERSIDVALDPALIDLTVHAEDQEGAAIPGVRIHVLDREGLPVDLRDPVWSTAEGQGILRGLGAGEYQILAAHPRFARAGRRVTLREGMSPLTLRLVEGEEIRLKTGGSRGPCSLRIVDARGTTVVEDACSHKSRFGGASLRLTPGPYRITVRSPGFDPVERNFEVAAGAIVTIDLR